MNITTLILLLFLLPTLQCKRDKLCGTGVIPFSGFKIVRQYKFSIAGFKPSSQQFITLVHCNHGKADYQKLVNVESITQIDWEKTYCMYKPRFNPISPGVSEDTVRSLMNGNTKGREINNTIESSPNKGIADKTTINHSSRFIGYLKTKFDLLLEYITGNSSPIEYTGKIKQDHIKDIESATIEASMEWEARNLVCYKLARRKKYSKRDISFYIPSTFVGGLYECGLTPDRKAQVYHNFKLQDTIKSFSFECDTATSKPLLPLVADYSTNQWWDIKKNIFSPSGLQNIPYLTTPDKLNLRFSLSGTPELSEDTWAAKIRVNEDYDFTEFDSHIISQAMATSSDLIFKLLKPIDWGKVLKQQEVDLTVGGKPITENDLVVQTVKRFSTDQKLALLLSVKRFGILDKLQNHWDNMVQEID